MPITLLATKFYCPPVRESLVSRPRLVDGLNAGMRRPLVLISAPAGYGKTTLLSEWRASKGRGYTLAWLTLDVEDNDPICFLTYFISALKQLKPGLGEAVIPTLQSPRPPSSETVLASILNELCELDQHFALVLDDYHNIEESTVHKAITFLLDHLPPCMHLVLLTRTEPPLPLSRLRGRNQLYEIGADELRFTAGEAEIFLNQVMSLGLSAGNLKILEQSTEGWIAGLQLIALSMQGRGDVNQFIASFKGSYHYIADYLVEEVLNRQSDEVRGFLLKTSILDRMNGSLCDVLTGAANGQEILEMLEHNNLFIVPLDDEQIWFRYHHLFAELLQNRLWREYPGRVPGLYSLAADWCNQQGFISEAIEYSISSGDIEHATQLIDLNASQLQKRGELSTLARWLGGLPEEMIRTRPRLCINYAWASAFTSGSPDTVDRYLRYAEQAIEGEIQSMEVQDLCGQIACIRANVAVFMGNNELALQLCDKAQNLLAESNAELRSYTALMAADASWMMGDGDKALFALGEAIHYSRSKGDLLTALISMNYLARILIAHGRLRQAHAVYREAFQLATDLGGQSWPATAVIYAGLGMLVWELNDAVAAKEYLTRGIELASLANDVDSRLFGYTTLARIHQAEGEAEQARQMLEQAERISQETRLPRDRYRVAARQAELMLAKGDIASATDWTRELTKCVADYFGDSPIPPLSSLHIAEQVMLARLLIFQAKPDEAVKLLTNLLAPLEKAGRIRGVIEGLAMQALALQAAGDIKQAMSTIKRALTVAEPEGFIRLFVDEGKPMAQLLSRIQGEGTGLKDYLSKLLTAFEPGEPRSETKLPSPVNMPEHLLIEPLSQRELEVLHLIANGCSNSDIARELVIAIGTVKRHTANIFNKLDVRNRTEAVARARELDLL